ncbi:MAG: hypothetical protein AAB614_01700 [Patescibacteria group bacterium]|mgnify:CR=1 FL=1
MNENNMQSQATKKGMNKYLITVVVIVILAIGFFIFNDKDSDTNKDAMQKTDKVIIKDIKQKDAEVMMKNDNDIMQKDSEAMVGKSDEVMMKKNTISYTSSGFTPASSEITIGETVTFVNESGHDMWVASAIHPTHELLPEFDQAGGTPNGTVYSFAFTKPGIWKFHDHLNPGMKGSVTVK